MVNLTENEKTARKRKGVTMNVELKDVFRKDKVERQMSSEKFGMEEPGREPKDIVFWVVLGLSQVIGLTLVGLTAYWCTLYGGFAWSSNADQQFYWHPLLMILGLVYFYGDAIIIYRVLSFLPKPVLKIIHGGLHVCAIISSSVALAAVLQYHWRTKKADFFSLHSWVGIATFAAFLMQYVTSFITFMVPVVPLKIRAFAMPFHTFFGIGIFLLSVVVVLMGFTEKLLWTPNYASGKVFDKATIGNVLGVLTIVFAFLIVFLATRPSYKRKPLPNELPHAPIN